MAPTSFVQACPLSSVCFFVGPSALQKNDAWFIIIMHFI